MDGPLSPPGSPTESQKAAFYPAGDDVDAPLLSHKWRSCSASGKVAEDLEPAAEGGSENNGCDEPSRRNASAVEGRGEGGGGGGGAEGRGLDGTIPVATGANGSGGDHAASTTSDGGSFRRNGLRSQLSKSSLTASRARGRRAAAVGGAAAVEEKGGGEGEEEFELGRRMVEAENDEELTLDKSCVFQ